MNIQEALECLRNGKMAAGEMCIRDSFSEEVRILFNLVDLQSIGHRFLNTNRVFRHDQAH